MLESLFNKVAGLQAYYFIIRRLQHGLFPVKFSKFLFAPFYRTPPAADLDEYSFLSKVLTRDNILQIKEGLQITSKFTGTGLSQHFSIIFFCPPPSKTSENQPFSDIFKAD